MVFQQIKLIFLNIIGLFRRALCCFSRKRKPSYSEPLVCINVVSKNNNQRTSADGKNVERDWNSWDDTPRTVEEHIEQYRQKLAKPPTPQKEEPEPDFFSELVPVIQPQPKYYLGNEMNEKTDFSRLEAKSDVPIATNADLEDWEDDDAGGWDELDTEQTKQLIREKRRELRNQRNQQTKSNGIVTESPRQGIEAKRLNNT